MPNVQKTKVAVVLTKTIYLSKGCLTRSNIAGDAIYLAQKDFVDEVNEKSAAQEQLAQKGHSLLTSLFNIQVIDSPKYTIPKNKEKKHSYSTYEKYNEKSIPLGDALRMIINYNLEKKYGVLDPIKNPKIYTHVPAVYDGDVMVAQEYYMLLPDIENEFYFLRDTYQQVLNQPQANIQNVEMISPGLGEFLDEEYDEDEDYNDDYDDED